MSNTPTTPASVASRLTDEEILKLAKDCDGLVSTDYATGEPDYFGDLEVKKAAVLRDYVRLRKLVDAIGRTVIDCCNLENDDKWKHDAAIYDIKRLLAEAEKGEPK